MSVQVQVSRRQLLAGGLFLGPWACARAAEPASNDRLVVNTWVSEPMCYFNYPHCNSFMSDTGLPVIARLSKDGRRVSLEEWDFKADRYSALTESSSSDMYWDVSKAEPALFILKDRHRITRIGRSQKEEVLQILRPPPSFQANQMLSVSTDGARVLYALAELGSAHDSLDVVYSEWSNGRAAELFRANFNANHHQYSPYDPDWVGICHEGNIAATHDRVWAWHRNKDSEEPSLLWSEKGDSFGYLIAGHERWMVNALSVLVVGYNTPGGAPAGLYKIDPVKRAARMISPSDKDLHCNISYDGEWAVVDTNEPSSSRFEPDGRRVTHIVLVRMSDGKRFQIARSHMKEHPWHAHPHFFPDGRHIVFNDFEHEGAGSPSRTVIVEIVEPS